ncbi:MAG: hypothetical protein ACRD15_03635, partial [Vicinamibacterales bacterium]
HFALLGPFPPSLTGAPLAYRAKSVLQRAASDLQPLTFPTRATIRRSDEHVRRLLQTIERTCPSAAPVIVASVEPVDARRVMWYVPAALVIHVTDDGVANVGREGRFVPVHEAPAAVSPQCPVLWLAPDGSPPPTEVPTGAARVAGVGFVINAEVVRVNRESVSFRMP